MKTSRQQTLPPGEGKSTSSQEGSPANRFQWQESDLERKMTATSGRTCCELYARYSPLGSLARTLLGSSRWYSPARSLKWVVKPLYSMRVTERERNNLTQSKKSAKVLNVRDIQSNRLLFQLVPLVRPTDGTEYGLLPTVQTQGLKTCEGGRSIPMNLALLPTPLSVEVLHAKRITQLKEKGGKTMGSRANGESRPNGLMDYLTFHSILPPPDSNGLENRNASGKQNIQSRHGFKAFSRKTDWADFPTQSPICNGNDRLSLGLVNITFPKWRAESVKALGNAIVPQVIYEIFKAIEDYERGKS